MAGSLEDANVQVKLVRDRDLGRTIATFYGSERAKEIRSSLDPQCLSGFRKNEKFEIEHSDVILTVDNGDFVFFDCAYEELLQSLGPINDTSSVPWTMFNDNVSMGYFDVYDQYLLNLLYDPRIKPGMTVQEVRAALPDVLADVRDMGAQGQQPAAVIASASRQCEDHRGAVITVRAQLRSSRARIRATRWLAMAAESSGNSLLAAARAKPFVTSASAPCAAVEDSRARRNPPFFQ